MIYLVTRHAGAKDWIEKQGVHIDKTLDHFDPEQTTITAADTVIGVLPPPLAAGVCEAGAKYWYMSMTVPREYRGCELSADDMQRFNARIDEYQIVKKQQIL